MVAEAIIAAIRVDQVEMACRDGLIEDIAERAKH